MIRSIFTLRIELMTDTVRCPSCRGAKKVPKLGGMIGECNTCVGKGTILACDKPIPVIVEPVPEVKTLIESVSNCVPASNTAIPWQDPKAEVKLLEPVVVDVKVDPKKALYKRKKA
jgi:RecJ-like exonuclease